MLVDRVLKSGSAHHRVMIHVVSILYELGAQIQEERDKQKEPLEELEACKRRDGEMGEVPDRHS